MTRRPPAFALLVVAMAHAVAGCTSPAKGEARALAHAVDAFRRGDTSRSAAAGLAQAVRDVPCSDPQVCAAKDACVVAIDPTAEAFAIKDQVASRLSEVETKRLAPDAAEAEALAGKLDEATRLLGVGRLKMAACDGQLAELTVKYGP